MSFYSTIPTENQTYNELFLIPNNRLIGVDIDLIHIRSTIDEYKILSSIKTYFDIEHAHCFPQNDLLGASCDDIIVI